MTFPLHGQNEDAENVAQLIAEMREVADDRRYSNEYVGNLFRYRLAELDRARDMRAVR